MNPQKVTRKEFVKYMAIGGVSFLTTPWSTNLFADQGLTGEARRTGFADPEFNKGAITHWGRLKFRCINNDYNWHVHPQGDMNLAEKINGELSTNISETWHVADIAKLEEMTKFPLLFMHAESPPALTDEEVDNLREYLMRGGFLYAEDCVYGYFTHGQRGPAIFDLFFQRMQTYLMNLIPGAQYVRLPLDHPIFHCYYDMRQGQPHMQGREHGGHGLIYEGRLVAYLSPSDAHCGWTSAKFFGTEKSVEATKMGTNVYLYALTH